MQEYCFFKVRTFSRHPSIVLLDYGFKDKRKIVLLLEYCDMGTLKQLLEERGKLENHVTAKIFSDTCCGLMYLHNKKIIHCDIKPDNILLTAEGIAKITDFGVALGPGQKHRRCFYGSDAYAAPETYLQNTYTTQSDVWSVGIVLYEMITGYRPFNNAKEVVSREIKVPEQTPYGALFLVRKLLQRIPSERLPLEQAISGWILIQLRKQIKHNTLTYRNISKSADLCTVSRKKALKNTRNRLYGFRQVLLFFFCG
ncbi:kinase domain protein, partial [Necator americanus]